MQAIEKISLRRIGFFSKAHGFRGELILVPDNPAPGRNPDTGFLFLMIDGLPVPFAIENFRDSGGVQIVKLEDVNDESSARKLTGLEVSILPAVPDEPEDIEYRDLTGYLAIDATFGPLGKIEAIEEFPMQRVARCTVKGKEVLFPLAKGIVVRVSSSKKEVRVNLPPGLLDIYLG